MYNHVGKAAEAVRRPGVLDHVGRGVVTLTVAIGVHLVSAMTVWHVVPGLFLVYASAVASLVYGRRG